jgi:hypothetical protein
LCRYDSALINALRMEFSGVSEAKAKKLGKCPHLLWRWIHAALKYQEAGLSLTPGYQIWVTRAYCTDC